MNRNEFNIFISGEAVPSREVIDSVRELATLFPWFSSAHLVMLRALKENSDIKFDTQLRNSALYVADREVLYHYLFMPKEIRPSEEPGSRSREELLQQVETRLNEIAPVPPEREADSNYAVEIEMAGEVMQNTELTDQKPEAFEGDKELLELVTTVEQEAEAQVKGEPVMEEPVQEEPPAPLSPADLIERFIQSSPRIERRPIHDNEPVRDLSESSTEEDGTYITETLARIYVNQGYYTKAINIYEKLTLKYPEKSAYFASRIEKIKELIK